MRFWISKTKVFAAVALAIGPSMAMAGMLQMDFNTDGQLPNQENPNLTRTSDTTFGGTNTNDDSVSGGLWHGDFRLGDQTGGNTSPRFRYYSGNNPVLAAASGAMSINLRLRFLAPVVANQNGNPNSDRDFYIQIRNGAGLLLPLFNYPTVGGATNEFGAVSVNGSVTMQPTGVSFADFHVYSIVWDGVFDGGGANGENDVADLYVDGNFIGTTRAFKGGQNSNGYIEFGDGDTEDGTQWEVDWIRWGTGADAIVVAPEPASTGLMGLALAALASRRRQRRGQNDF